MTMDNYSFSYGTNSTYISSGLRNLIDGRLDIFVKLNNYVVTC